MSKTLDAKDLMDQLDTLEVITIPGKGTAQYVRLSEVRGKVTGAKNLRNAAHKKLMRMLWVNDTRYRFLRDAAQWLENVPHVVNWARRNVGHTDDVILSEEELDKAIDVAIKQHNVELD